MRYMVTMGYQFVVNARDEDSAIEKAREEIEWKRKAGDDYDIRRAEEYAVWKKTATW